MLLRTIIFKQILLREYSAFDQMQNIYHIKEQAFDSIAGNTVVPYRSLKKFFNYHKLLYFAIYNPFVK